MRLAAMAAIAAALTLSATAAAQDTLPRRAGAIAETYPGVTVSYGSVADPAGHRMRVITTRPSAPGRYPTVFVAGWLSCDSIEAPAATRDPTGQVFRAIAQMPGVALVRMDKAGIGDSEGDCSKTDFNTELGAYRAAFRQMKSASFVDPSRIIVLGISNGGGFAPLVTEGTPVAGYVTVGAWSRTWFEHMIDIERLRYTLSGKKPEEIAALATNSARLYQSVLVEGRDPAAVIAANPALRSAWDSDTLTELYGRPVAYYQQLQQLNLAEAWSKVRAPALVLWGEYDWIMSRYESEGIVSLVNAGAPNAARLVVLEDTGHTLQTYISLKNAFDGPQGAFNPASARLITDWIRERVK